MRGFKRENLEPRQGWYWIGNAGKPQPLVFMNGVCCGECFHRSGAGNIASLVGQDVPVGCMERATLREKRKMIFGRQNVRRIL